MAQFLSCNPSVLNNQKEACLCPVKTAESCLETARSSGGKGIVHPLKLYFHHCCVNLGSGDISSIMDYNIKRPQKNIPCLCIRRRCFHCVFKVECPSGLVSGAMCNLNTWDELFVFTCFNLANKEMSKNFITAEDFPLCCRLQLSEVYTGCSWSDYGIHWKKVSRPWARGRSRAATSWSAWRFIAIHNKTEINKWWSRQPGAIFCHGPHNGETEGKGQVWQWLKSTQPREQDFSKQMQNSTLLKAFLLKSTVGEYFIEKLFL